MISFRELVAGQLLRLPDRFQEQLRRTAASQLRLAPSAAPNGPPPATVSEAKTSVMHTGDADRVES